MCVSVIVRVRVHAPCICVGAVFSTSPVCVCVCVCCMHACTLVFLLLLLSVVPQTCWLFAPRRAGPLYIWRIACCWLTTCVGECRDQEAGSRRQEAG